MGTSKKHRDRFFASNPICAFCGGISLATTIEHCPPRALFQNRWWPESFEFPACESCNAGSSDDDLMIAVFGRMNPFVDDSDLDGRLPNMIKNLNSQYPGMLEKMLPSASEARRLNRKLGLTPRLGDTHQEAGALKISPEMRRAIGGFAGKLAKAIFYLHTHTIFPANGCLVLAWFTNADLIRDGKYNALELLKDVHFRSLPAIRNGESLHEQFTHKFSPDENGEIFATQVTIGAAFAFVVFGSTIPGRLESHLKNLTTSIGKRDAFTIIQSDGSVA